MKLLPMLALAVATALGLAGCASQSANISAFTDPTFQQGSIRTLAIFPMLNASVAPGEGQNINRTIGPRILAANPGLRVVSPAEAIAAVNRAGLAQQWAAFLDAFSTSGIPDSAILQQVGQAIGADAILQGEVGSVVQQDGIYGARAGASLVTVQFSLLETRTGKLLWQASSEGRSITATTVESAPPLAEAVGLATDKLVTSMPRL